MYVLYVQSDEQSVLYCTDGRTVSVYVVCTGGRALRIHVVRTDGHERTIRIQVVRTDGRICAYNQTNNQNNYGDTALKCLERHAFLLVDNIKLSLIPDATLTPILTIGNQVTFNCSPKYSTQHNVTTNLRYTQLGLNRTTLL